MNRLAPFLLGLSCTLPAWGAVDLNFVRSAADCDRNGCGLQNGSSFSNAWRTQAAVVYSGSDGTANAVDPEDWLYFCSEDFHVADIDTASVMINPSANVSGSASAYTTFDGDCSQFGGPKMAKFNGGGTIDRGFDVGSTQRTYIRLQNFELFEFDQYGVIEQGAATDSAFWILDNLYIHDIRGPTARGVWSKSADMTLLRNRIHRTGEDNLYLEGDRFLMVGNDLQDGGLDAVGGQGDNMQFGVTEAEGFVIIDNSFKAAVDMKQCALIGTAGLATSGVLMMNRCYGPKIGAENHTAFFIRGTGSVLALGNYANNSRYLLYASSGLSLRATGNIGHDLSSYGIQCGTGATDCDLSHNTVARAPVCFSTESASGTSKIANNIGVDCTTVGIRKNAGDSEVGNDLYRAASMVQDETAPVSPSATTVSVDPRFVGGTQPNTVNGFRLLPTSPVCGAGVWSGKYFDKTGRRILPPVTPGAIQCGRGRAPALR